MKPIAPRPWPLDSAEAWLAWKVSLDDSHAPNVALFRAEAERELQRIGRAASTWQPARSEVVPRTCYGTPPR